MGAWPSDPRIIYCRPPPRQRGAAGLRDRRSLSVLPPGAPFRRSRPTGRTAGGSGRLGWFDRTGGEVVPESRLLRRAHRQGQTPAQEEPAKAEPPPRHPQGDGGAGVLETMGRASAVLVRRRPGGAASALGRGTINASGAETGGFNQADLVATGRELTALVALHDHTTA